MPLPLNLGNSQLARAGFVLTSLEPARVVVWLAGAIDLALAPDLAQFAAHLRRLRLDIELDVSGMTFCDSTLASFIVNLRGAVSVTIREPPRHLVELLQIWNLPNQSLSGNVSSAAALPAGNDHRHPTPAGSGAAEMDRLLRRVAAGDHAAFEALYVAARPRVHAIATRVIRNHAIAVEAVQECFLDVWRLSANFDPARGTAMSWIATIAHRRSVDLVRSAQANTRRDIAYGLATHTRPLVDETESTVLSRVEAREALAALEGLSLLQRQAVQLVFFSGLTIAEIALDLDVPIPTLRTRLRDGLQRLRGALTTPAEIV